MRILMLDNEFPPLGGGMGTVNQAMLQCFVAYPDWKSIWLRRLLEELPGGRVFFGASIRTL